MKMTDKDKIHEARSLIALYFEGLTTLGQERRLRELLSDPNLQDEEADQARAVMSFAAISQDTVPPVRNRRPLYAAIASVAASAAVIVLIASLFLKTSPAATDYLAYVDGQRIDNPEEVMLLVNADLSLLGEASEDVNDEIDGDLNALSSALNGL